MRLKTRIKSLEKKFECYKPLPAFILVYEGMGEDCETKYQEYLDRGGDPDAEIIYILYRNPPGREYPKPVERPD
jgi:hypothetical protein